MSYKNTRFQILARTVLLVLIANIISPMVQYSSAAAPDYYVSFFY